MKKIFIWLLKKLMNGIYIFFINLPKLNNIQNDEVEEFYIIKKISRINLPAGTKKIITFSDMHLGHKHNNTRFIKLIIEKENPDAVILKGDTFDSKRSLKNLRKDELELINFLRKFGQTTNKRLIVIKGDHDWWLTNKNLLGVRVYEKIIAKVGNEQIIASHGDESDKHKKTNGNFLKKIIEPCFYFLDWLNKEYNNKIAQELLDWATKTPVFIGMLRYSKKLSGNEAIKLKCKVVLLGHFHFKYKFVIKKIVKGMLKRIIYIMLKGSLDAPKQYIRIRIKENGKIRIRIKNYHAPRT